MHTNFISIFLFGFFSGLPFLLILATLTVWLAESGLSKIQISFFSYVTLPYSFKFILAVFIDRVKIPFLYTFLGKRRSWLLLSQFMIFVGLSCIAMTNPILNYKYTAFFSFFVGLCSAIQDLVIEAYRIEILKNNNMGYGAGISILGYRFGMLVSGAGTIFCVMLFDSWSIAYFLMSLCFLLALINTILSREPIVVNYTKNSIFSLFKDSIFTFSNMYNLKIIILFVIFFKIIDVMLNVMSIPFLIDIGFSKLEIAYTCRTYGIITMIIGVVFGGVFISRKNIWKFFIFCSLLQIITAILFIFQAFLKKNIFMLFITIGVENFVSGVCQVSLVTYLSLLSSVNYTAIYYSFLSSLSSFVRVNISLLSGFIADFLSWEYYFLVVTLLGFPVLFILKKNINDFSKFYLKIK